MIQLDFQSQKKNLTPTPPKNLQLLVTLTPQPCLQLWKNSWNCIAHRPVNVLSRIYGTLCGPLKIIGGILTRPYHMLTCQPNLFLQLLNLAPTILTSFLCKIINPKISNVQDILLTD